MTEKCMACKTELIPNGKFCHNCGAPVAGIKPRLPLSQRMCDYLRWTVVAAWLACVLAWLMIILIDTETVLITGPIVFFSGTLIGIAGLYTRNPGALILGPMHCLICIILAMLVNIFRWSPGEATMPFIYIGGAYTLINLPISIMVFKQFRRPESSWICKQCGYILYALTEPRCPECGTPFDPGKLTKDSTFESNTDPI